MLTNEELLQKAMFTTPDLGQAVSVAEADRFINLVTESQEMLKEVRTVTHTEAKWREAAIDFAARIARPGVEGQRVAEADRPKPVIAMIEMSPVLLKGEVVMSKESLEDAISRNSLENELETAIATRFGNDVEELMVAGDTAIVGDPFLALLDGWLKQARGAGGNVLAAGGFGQDYQAIFRRLLGLIPQRFKRNLRTDGRFYVPWALEEAYRDILSRRGTALGDIMLTGTNEVRYQGILIKGVSSFPITAGTPDTSQVLLSNRLNLYSGWRRRIEFDTDYSKREGNISYLVDARVASEMAVVEATATATGVDVEPT